MSNYVYPIWWDRDLTVYNKYENPVTQVVTWKRTELYHCFWKRGGTEVRAGNVLIDTENVTCRIPKHSKFVSDVEWASSELEALKDKFTLQTGDIIVFGICTDFIDEYTKGKRSTDLLSKFRRMQGCIEIKSVSINTQTGMDTPHYKVVGK